jgi:hypothetical protein
MADQQAEVSLCVQALGLCGAAAAGVLAAASLVGAGSTGTTAPFAIGNTVSSASGDARPARAAQQYYVLHRGKTPGQSLVVDILGVGAGGTPTDRNRDGTLLTGPAAIFYDSTLTTPPAPWCPPVSSLNGVHGRG